MCLECFSDTEDNLSATRILCGPFMSCTIVLSVPVIVTLKCCVIILLMTQLPPKNVAHFKSGQNDQKK